MKRLSVLVATLLFSAVACGSPSAPTPTLTPNVGGVCFSTTPDLHSCAGQSQAPSFSVGEIIYLYADIDFAAGSFVWVGTTVLNTGTVWGGYWGDVPMGHGWTHKIGTANGEPEVKPGEASVDQINIWLKDDASPDGRTLIGQGYFSVLPQVQEDQSSSPSPAGLLPAGG